MVEFTCTGCGIRVVGVNYSEIPQGALCVECNAINLIIGDTDRGEELMEQFREMREGGYTYEDAVRRRTLIQDAADMAKDAGAGNATRTLRAKQTVEVENAERNAKARAKRAQQKGGK